MGFLQALVDTSAILAILNRRDQDHDAAKRILQRSMERRERFLITNLVLAETYGLILVRLGAPVAREWLRTSTLPAERVLPVDEGRAREILFAYEDKDFSYVDATSFAVMERLGIDTAFAFDRHFEQFGFKVLDAA